MSKVVKMTSDCWKGRKDYSIITNNPSFEEIEEAVQRLDGENRTIVVLCKGMDDEKFLMISGAWNDKYMINTTEDGYDYFSVVDANQTDEMVTLYVGGQDGEFEKNKLVPKEWVITAVKVYFESGGLDEQLNWQSDY